MRQRLLPLVKEWAMTTPSPPRVLRFEEHSVAWQDDADVERLR